MIYDPDNASSDIKEGILNLVTRHVNIKVDNTTTEQVCFRDSVYRLPIEIPAEFKPHMFLFQETEVTLKRLWSSVTLDDSVHDRAFHLVS
jgi:hypothetical protein